jgi:cation diffusion facilitator CzcD-associated flavoprotein CzcO
MAFDEKTEKWVVTATDGVIRTAQFVITAVGCLSKPSEPALYHEALATFNGPVYLTGRWPHTPLDFSGKRVGVVGTGSSGIQAIPILAAEAAELTVFQRTPQYTIPANNHPLDKECALAPSFSL